MTVVSLVREGYVVLCPDAAGSAMTVCPIWHSFSAAAMRQDFRLLVVALTKSVAALGFSAIASGPLRTAAETGCC